MTVLPAEHLATLSDIVKLAQIDYSIRPLTLTAAPDNRLMAVYQGSYVNGTITVPLPEGEEWPTAVIGAEQFKDIVGLFPPDKAVTLSVGSANLTLSCDGRRAALRLMADEPAMPMNLTGKMLPPLTLQKSVFSTEVGIAGNFVSETNSVPVFTGIRLLKGAGNLAIMAQDGRAGIYAAQVPCDSPEVTFDATVHHKDLLTALSVVGKEETVELVVELNTNNEVNHILIRGTYGTVILGVLAGKWPNTTPVTKPFERQSLVLPIELLKTAIASVKALRADEVLILEKTEGGVVLHTLDAEMGRFDIAIPGEIVFDKVIYGAQELRLASLLGEDITIEIGEGRVPSLVRTSTRRYWISRKIG